MRKRYGVVVAILAAGQMGCGTADEGASSLQQPLGPASQFFSNDGRRFVLVESAAERVLLGSEDDKASRSLARVFDMPVEALSVDELAEALRPVTLVDGHEYRLEFPDYEAATLALSKRGFSGSSYNPAGEPVVPHGKSFCCGSDGRLVVRNNTTWPFTTIIAMAIPDSGTYSWTGGVHSECTMQLIGPSTATSVAHCFHDSVNWRELAMWGAAPDAQDASMFPPGFPGAYGCYVAYIPAAWVGSGGNFQYDHAVIDFRNQCQPAPGNIAGWLGWGAFTDAEIQSASGWGYGVPALSPYPQIRGMGTSAATISATGYVIDHSADCSDGDSGRGFWQYIANDYRSTGNHARAPVGGKCRERRLTTDVAAFIAANSEF